VLLVDAIRAACARVASEARSVRIDGAALERSAAALPLERAAAHEQEPALADPDAEARAGFALALAAINFGSGWWPTIRKQPGLSGYFTISRALVAWFDGGRSASELAALTPAAVARMLGQDPEHELMALYASHLGDVGARVEEGYGGSFCALVDAASGSAPRLVELLAAWPSFLDVSVYGGRPVPLFKRAQIAAAELARAGPAPLDGLERLTMFADNLVPHVLRLDGVLVYDPQLLARIEREELLEHGSAEEVEIRACALAATEEIARLRSLPAATVDRILWNSGQQARYKAHPRHRARCSAY
jgi:hypothetical protein